MQTLQIDKLGAGLFDGTTLLNPAIDPVIITRDAAESRTILTIPDGTAVGRIDIGAILGIPAINSFMVHDIAIGGDFIGAFTGGNIQILGPPNPTAVSRPTLTYDLTAATGIRVTSGPRWFLPNYLLGITTAGPDTGPYRVVLLVEKIPNQKLMASVASGMLS